ncbi:MAG: helix-turn-helix domain-containing protein [Verrucomicrobia bacterium]|nr:helix-turn-helix domain-containing protein [Verrucomicrobiota bacterium]
MKSIAINQSVPDQLITEPELAERLQISHRTAVTRRQNGELPYVLIGRLVRYNWNDVVAHLKRNSGAR